MTKEKNDLVILDYCLSGITGLDQLPLFKNSKIVRLQDLGLNQNSLDKEIIDKAIVLAESNEYLSVSILTEDKGRDGDKNLTTPHKKIVIIYCSHKNLIEKIKDSYSSIKNLSQWTGHYVEIYDVEVRKTKFPKYDQTIQTKIEHLKNKKVYETSYTK